MSNLTQEKQVDKNTQLTEPIATCQPNQTQSLSSKSENDTCNIDISHGLFHHLSTWKCGMKDWWGNFWESMNITVSFWSNFAFINQNLLVEYFLDALLQLKYATPHFLSSHPPTRIPSAGSIPLQIHLLNPYFTVDIHLQYIYHTNGGKHTSPMDAICLGWWIHYESTYNFFSWLVLTGKDGWRSIGFFDSTWVLNRTCCQKRQICLFFVFEVWKGFVWYCWWFRNLAITSWGW